MAEYHDDLIRRSDALAQFPQSGDERWMIGDVINMGSVRMRLQRVPAVNAVEVVHCGACKHWNTDGYCYVVSGCTQPDFYCAAGERREVMSDE